MTNTPLLCIDSVGAVFFIDAPGGTGKTYVSNALLAFVRSTGGIALPVASSGIAAQLLKGGRTVHSRFKVPLKVDKHSYCSIARTKSSLCSLLTTCSFILWDEAPAQHQDVIGCVDRSLRDICKIDALFGGKVVVFAGDFRQVCIFSYTHLYMHI